MIPDMQMSLVDVRDVADAHVKALTTEHFNERYILVNTQMMFVDLAQHLSDEFKPIGYSVCTRRLPKFLAAIGSWVSNDIARLWAGWGIRRKVDTTKAREVLGMEFRDTEKSLIEMGYSLMD
jgi:nucleoside-diphosphate-sugar epimerase